MPDRARTYSQPQPIVLRRHVTACIDAAPCEHRAFQFSAVVGTAVKELLGSNFGTIRDTLAWVGKVFNLKTCAWWHVPCHGITGTALLHCRASHRVTAQWCKSLHSCKLLPTCVCQVPMLGTPLVLIHNALRTRMKHMSCY